MPYNPFRKPIGTPLTEEDLQELLGRAAEGYYVEYKSTFRAPQKIAHGIASLANTYGGWYIVGVTTDENHFAKEICGFSSEEFPDPVMKVRDSVKDGIDPVPLFFPTPVRLKNGRSVLVVYVPGDQRTPFITKDGKIYRRNHDSSDPVPENSRHILDRLVERGREADQRFAQFCEKGEKAPLRTAFGRSLAWANFFFRPDPLGIVERPNISTPDEVNKLLELSRGRFPLVLQTVQGNIPFNMVRPTLNSVVLRQTADGLPNQPGIAAEFTGSGSLRLNIPLPTKELGERHGAQNNTRAFNALEEVFERADHRRDHSVRRMEAIDAGELYVQLFVLLSLYREWLGTSEWIPGFRCAFSLRGVAQTVPFADVDAWGRQVEQWGLPMLESDIQIPNRWEDAGVIENMGADSHIWPVFRALGREMGLADDVALQALSVTTLRLAGVEVPEITE
jgi:hypothetical protein